MNIALCTLCLNESEFLAKSYEQHKDWPGLVGWIFVEAADIAYAKASPDLVDCRGLSTDDTADVLIDLATKDGRVVMDRMGWMPNDGANSKIHGRNRYLSWIERQFSGIDAFIVLDADEFYTREDQERIHSLVSKPSSLGILAWRTRQRHIWRPPSIVDVPLFSHEVIGGYWYVPHTRIFRWRPGIRHRRDHNWPESSSYQPLRRTCAVASDGPQCIHLGFARSSRERVATNRYYVARGEGAKDGREKYVQCRGAWEGWKPGEELPAGARVVPYDGPIPECYMTDQGRCVAVAPSPSPPEIIAPG